MQARRCSQCGFEKIGIMMIVAIIGRLVTPETGLFFRANCEYLPMLRRAGQICVRAQTVGMTEPGKESGPGWTGLHYFSRFHTSLRKSVLPGKTMLGERGWDAG
jgi:hypothetical protein